VADAGLCSMDLESSFILFILQMDSWMPRVMYLGKVLKSVISVEANKGSARRWHCYRPAAKCEYMLRSTPFISPSCHSILNIPSRPNAHRIIITPKQSRYCTQQTLSTSRPSSKPLSCPRHSSRSASTPSKRSMSTSYSQPITDACPTNGPMFSPLSPAIRG
jgi:hypothetical protein